MTFRVRMWNTLTLQRPKTKEKASNKNVPQDKFKLRRAKTFCDGIKDHSDPSRKQTTNKTWLKNIRNWRKKFTKAELNYQDRFQEPNRESSSSRDSLDKIRWIVLLKSRYNKIAKKRILMIIKTVQWFSICFWLDLAYKRRIIIEG